MLCRVLCHADICGSTWKQVYEYLCLRLDFESVKPRTEESLYHLLQDKQEILAGVLTRLVAGRELWNADHHPSVYRGAKQTFRNIHMLVRLLQSFCPEKIKLTSGTDIELMNLLRDWNSALCNKPICYVDYTGETRRIDASSGTEYRGLSLSGCRIDGIFFDRCFIRWGSFVRAMLNDISFREAVLYDVYMSDAILLHNQFDRTRMRDVRMHDTSLINTFFRSASLDDIGGPICMEHCWIYPDTQLLRSELKRSNFTNVYIQGLTVESCKLGHGVFENVQLRDCVIRDTDFSAGNFDGTITGVVFEDCDFSSTRFKRPDTFRDVTFRRCRFAYVRFRDMDLSDVTFEDCDFKDADIPQIPEQ